MEEVVRGVVCAILLIGCLAIVVLVILAQAGRIAREKDRYRSLAERLSGECIIENYFAAHSVAFPHGKTSGIFDTYSEGVDRPSDYTRVRMVWRGANVRLEVFPAGPMHRFVKLLVMVDLEIGVPEFDNDYVIHGDDVAAIRKLLTAEVRRIIECVRAQAKFGEMYLSLKRGELLLRRRGLFDTDAQMEQFVRAAKNLFDELAGDYAKGIQFLDAIRIDDSNTAQTATCQVCGEVIGTDPVLCNSCRTPHHRDCWEYYGKCSTFGCHERGYFRPRRQAAAKGRK